MKLLNLLFHQKPTSRTPNNLCKTTIIKMLITIKKLYKLYVFIDNTHQNKAHTVIKQRVKKLHSWFLDGTAQHKLKLTTCVTLLTKFSSSSSCRSITFPAIAENVTQQQDCIPLPSSSGRRLESNKFQAKTTSAMNECYAA